ncbi:MAG: tripartite tricarboxylate transporter substrate-binding protein [Pseudomonadota bacterium]
MRRPLFPRALRLFSLAVLAVLLPLHEAGAQVFPDRPLKIIVPFPAGGTQDSLARTLADALAQGLKQPVLVDNRTGASGNIGADVLAKAKPDGYTLGVLSGVQSANAAFYRRLPYDLDRDFVPVRALGDSDVVIVASPRAPFATMSEFLAYAKANPSRLNFGSTTSSTMDLLRVRTGVAVTMVTYKGPSDAMQDLISGRIELSAGPLPQMLPLIRDGKIRALALASARRTASLEGVPTVGETVPGYDAGMWYGLYAPTGTPVAVVERLAREVGRVMDSAETRAKLQALGIDPGIAGAPVSDMQARARRETAQWRAVVEATGNYAN